ncbi:MAG: hypothetical protein OEQ25_10530 [Gammaproteobacteria bacterium]|nr:hypothetical protein [Gammaproteobacteria bacterium]MDH3507563.1 hypothetical protein [Gammaproteobacteria bacterium]
MKKLDLGQTINTLANMGVIAGIAFLAVELRQNSQVVRAQSRAQISSEAADHIMRRAENAELAEIQLRANGGEQLTRLEQERLFLMAQSTFRRWENIHYQYRQGLYSEEEFAGNTRAWRGALSNRVNRQYWETRRDQFSPDFAAELDRLILDIEHP